MLFRKASAVSLGVFLTLGVLSPFAQDGFTPPATPEEAVATRQALMREDGGILRSAAGLTGADAVAAATTLRDNYSHIVALFPEGSLVGDTEALPAIWENFDAFSAIVDTGIAAAEEALTSAEAGDTTAYVAALESLQGTCGQCHQQFRAD